MEKRTIKMATAKKNLGGRPAKFGEETTIISFRVPKSRRAEIERLKQFAKKTFSKYTAK